MLHRALVLTVLFALGLPMAVAAQAPAVAPDDAEGRTWAEQVRGRPLLLVDRVEFAAVQQSQPRWRSFMRGDFDLLAVPDDFVNVAAPNKRLAPNLAKLGMQLVEAVQPTTMFTYFGMAHPVVGGYEPHKVALRRAQSLPPPGVSGFDPGLRSEMSEHDPARVKALLDLLYGRNKGMANHARFGLPTFAALYERQRAVPDGPERDALMGEATRLSSARMPYKDSVHAAVSWVMHPASSATGSIYSSARSGATWIWRRPSPCADRPCTREFLL